VRDVKEAGDVDAQYRREIGFGVLGERLGNEDAGGVRREAQHPGALW
jgi:hypothetical protein